MDIEGVGPETHVYKITIYLFYMVHGLNDIEAGKSGHWKGEVLKSENIDFFVPNGTPISGPKKS